MEKFITCNDIPIRIATQGSNPEGRAVVLLHGYMGNLEVWDNVAKQLGKDFYVLTLDLPGHGFSGTHGELNSMALMADVVGSACRQVGISSAVVVGHSMGGYAALALALRHPALVAGLCLLHATPRPDSDERRQQRDREIALIAEGKREQVAQQSLSAMFAIGSASQRYEALAELEVAAAVASDEGLIASLRGMKERPDMSSFLATLGKPLLLVFGKKDRRIPWEEAAALAASYPRAQALALENSGHAGFIEEEQAVVKSLAALVQRCYATEGAHAQQSLADVGNLPSA